MKSVVRAVRSNTGVELIGKIMECGERLKNDGGVVMRVINSLSEASTTMVVISSPEWDNSKCDEFLKTKLLINH